MLLPEYKGPRRPVKYFDVLSCHDLHLTDLISNCQIENDDIIKSIEVFKNICYSLFSLPNISRHEDILLRIDDLPFYYYCNYQDQRLCLLHFG